MSERKKKSLLALSAIPALLLATLLINQRMPAPEPVPAVVAANDH